MEITIKIDGRNKDAKALIEYLKNLSFVKIERAEKSPYNPDFVKMIKDAETSKNRTRVTSKNLWQSI